MNRKPYRGTGHTYQSEILRTGNEPLKKEITASMLQYVRYVKNYRELCISIPGDLMGFKHFDIECI